MIRNMKQASVPWKGTVEVLGRMSECQQERQLIAVINARLLHHAHLTQSSLVRRPDIRVGSRAHRIGSPTPARVAAGIRTPRHRAPTDIRVGARAHRIGSPTPARVAAGIRPPFHRTPTRQGLGQSQFTITPLPRWKILTTGHTSFRLSTSPSSQHEVHQQLAPAGFSSK